MTSEPHIPDRIWSKIAPDPHTGCWVWTAARDEDGYGLVWSDARMGRVHRVVYEALIGPIPAGLVVDHLCRNRACCNPGHLEPVTSRENSLRGETVAADNAAKTHCPAGHEYTTENTGYFKSGRQCKECNRIAARDRMRRKRALKVRNQ